MQPLIEDLAYERVQRHLALHLALAEHDHWNARYMTASIDHLHTTRPDVVADEDALARVAPVTHAHVNSLGRYDLNRQPPPLGQLRPLRPADPEAQSADDSQLDRSGVGAGGCASAAACGSCVRDLDQLLADAEAPSRVEQRTVTDEPDTHQGWRDAEQFWGGP